jgi:aminoglycoside phosphotransferase family enzyme
MKLASPPPCAHDTMLDEKVAFLSEAGSYGLPPGDVMRRETHMSWVFLAGDGAYKLKKPVRFPYLDFSTLSRREQACRAELALNRRLAPDVYTAMVPLVRSGRGLAIGTAAGGSGDIVDWLVAMRRLDPAGTLEHAIATRRLAPWQLDGLLATLAAFYRHATPVLFSPETHLLNWRRSVAFNACVLLDPRLGLPAGLVRQIIGIQRRFLVERSGLIAGRVRGRHVVDGHGDLRPEHIWLGHPVRIIDCLEFNAALRAVDPFDEMAFLSVECERLGCAWAAGHIRRRAGHLFPEGATGELFAFYRCHRASLRARLAAARLLEPDPRTPEKWRRLAATYLRLAARDARRLERFLGTCKEDLPGQSSGAANEPLRRARLRRNW